ncbi:MAG: GNAT family N-acetyltransferase [Candidatus Omnitrophota bacterium]|nr:GNAT family N-acetyltransferase [Candidatus Omnitrophota bacterium]
MPQEPQVKIRSFNKTDRQAVRDIFYATAFLGEPADAFFDGKEIICDALTAYFTDYEPEACFVAYADGVVAGCLIGAKNKAVCDKIVSQRIFPGLIWKALASGAFFNWKNIRLMQKMLCAAIRGEFKAPDFSTEYPATLHINLKKEYRAQGIGARLIGAYCDYLAKEKIPGVCLATMSERAGAFFSEQGFALLHTGMRSYFSHILKRDVPVFIYGKILK